MSVHLQQSTPAARLLGRNVEGIDTATGRMRVRFHAKDEFLNRHGTVQGGLLAAMLDSAAGNAVLATLPADLTTVTTRLDTRYVAPAKAGPLVAESWVVRTTERTVEVAAELMDEARRVVATAVAEMRIVRRKVPAAT